MIVDNGAENGLVGAVMELHLGSVEEVAYPEVIDVVQFVGLAHVGAFFQGEPPLGFDDPQQGVVVNRGIPQEMLITKIFVEFLSGQVGVCLAFYLNDLDHLLIQAPGSTPVRSILGFEGVKSTLAILSQPGLHSGDADFSEAITGEVMLLFRLLTEVLILGPRRFGKDGRYDLVTCEGDPFPDIFFHVSSPLLFLGVHERCRRPMDNPFKKQELANPCTIMHQNRVSHRARKAGPSKQRVSSRKLREGYKEMGHKTNGIDVTHPCATQAASKKVSIPGSVIE